MIAEIDYSYYVWSRRKLQEKFDAAGIRWEPPVQDSSVVRLCPENLKQLQKMLEILDDGATKVRHSIINIVHSSRLGMIVKEYK